MSKFWSDIVADLHPYVAGEQPRIANLTKLNTNENPYGPSPKALEAIKTAADERLRLYPDPVALELREAIAARYGVTADEVFVGNGSDEVLAHTFAALLKHEKPLLYPDISYSFYPVYCQLYDIAAETVPLDADFAIRPADYDRDCGAIILPNPNAPTGRALTLDEIRELLNAHRDIPVVIDEAYVDFGAESAVTLVKDYDNLLVVQTFSKSRSLAGMRVGFAIGQRPLIDALERVKDSFNSYPLDRLVQVAAKASIEDEAWFEECRAKVITTRDWLTDALEALGFDVLPSKANFVFAKHETVGGGELYAGLRERAVLVRHFNKPRIADYLRMTIGTQGECEKLVAALKEILT
ncbi:histidinol-phosphate transaminase [Rhizobium sp. L1K21]|uniref:histidinol-phosphate transaminase n=1 Tax=Rhizobium sp. L1K21 TaxID=2954933 RepID=UPI0020922453|nr:histidinol-phosphate transaminase [Rhizobium sp. L1K21]MCO6188122.1 histidinol-phosphate transaminase [Rhizobium sp. L1K21]